MAGNMDVDQNTVDLVSSKANVTFSVTVHPVVILSISEHWARICLQDGAEKPAIGALIGKQRGRHLEIISSFELVVDENGVISHDYYATKEEQFKQVLPDLDLIGWYNAGTETPNELDARNHACLSVLNENAVLLKVNPYFERQDPPFTVWEPVREVTTGNDSKLSFVPLKYQMSNDDAERIGIEHVARISHGNNRMNSVVFEHLQALYNAVKMLSKNVDMVQSYVKSVDAGLLPYNPKIMYEISTLSNQIPQFRADDYDKHFYSMCNDVALITLLGTVTKGCYNLQRFLLKFEIAHDRKNLKHTKMKGILM